MPLYLNPLFAFFANPLMLGWLAAAGVPLVIHLLSRRRYREMQWAAMSFLISALRKNARRVQLEQWLLLALRTLIVLLVVLALAEPFLEATGITPSSSNHVHKVIVVDSSFSMAFKPTDKSRFDRAKELAHRIVEESLTGDGFTLVMLAAPPRAVVATPAFEPRDFRAEIDNLVLPHGGADLPATLAMIESLIEQAQHDHPRFTHHQVFFLTDLGRNTWSIGSDSTAPPTEASKNSVSVGEFLERSKRLATKASLQVIDLGQDDAENSAITRFTISDPYTTTAREVQFEADVKNFGRQRRDQVLVELHVDERRVGEEKVTLEPGGQTTVDFRYRFDTPGPHLAELRLGNDLLAIDNHRWYAADVHEFLRVLLINGKPSGGELRGATDYLAVALEPKQQEQDRPLVRVDVAAESALVERDLTSYDCVFLCNVAQFTAQEASVLAAYLRYGGGAVFFMGDQVNADSYNRVLGASQSSTPGTHTPLLPATLGETIASGMFHFNPLGYQHPIVNLFRDQEQAGLITTPIQRYVKLQVQPESAAKVALAFDSGDPAIVEQPFERGRVVVVATSADLSWTAMPVGPSYLPIVQELLAWSVEGHRSEHNTLVGGSFGDQGRSLAGQSVVTIKLPNGDSTAVRIQSGLEPSWSFNDTLLSGAYQANVTGSSQPVTSFAVNVDTSESDLTRLDAAELRNQTWPGVRFSHRTDWQNLAEGESEAIARRNALHQWLLIAAGFGMMAEMSLASWWGRRSR